MGISMGLFKRSFKEEVKVPVSLPETKTHERGAVIVAVRTSDCEYPIIEREIPPEKTICQFCKEITIDGVEFCSHCGRKLL